MRAVERRFLQRWWTRNCAGEWFRWGSLLPRGEGFPPSSIDASHSVEHFSGSPNDANAHGMDASALLFRTRCLEHGLECNSGLDPFGYGLASSYSFRGGSAIRCYAAPVNKVALNKKKLEEEEPPEKDERRVNRAITSKFIRVISHEGNHVYSRADALKLAMTQGLDLVEVDGRSNPPVAKLMDYSRFRFEEKRKEKEIRRKQIEKRRMDEVKEIRFGTRTEEKDLVMKATMAKRLLQKGHRIKFTIQFRKNDVRTNGKLLLDKMMNLLKDDAKIEVEVRDEGMRMWMIIRPNQKNSKKNAIDSATNNSIESENRSRSSKRDAELIDDTEDTVDNGMDEVEDDDVIDDGDVDFTNGNSLMNEDQNRDEEKV